MGKERVLEGKKKAHRSRRCYTAEFKSDAVQMLLDGHTAPSVCERLFSTVFYPGFGAFALVLPRLDGGGPGARGAAAGLHDRQPGGGLIHHTDRGGQYASREYRNVLRRSGMVQSMGAAGNCYDNAFMESCFGTIKTDLEMVEYRNGAEALRDLASYIGYYNGERLHSSLGYVSPIEFERQQPVQKTSTWTVRAN